MYMYTSANHRGPRAEKAKHMIGSFTNDSQRCYLDPPGIQPCRLVLCIHVMQLNQASQISGSWQYRALLTGGRVLRVFVIPYNYTIYMYIPIYVLSSKYMALFLFYLLATWASTISPHLSFAARSSLARYLVHACTISLDGIDREYSAMVCLWKSRQIQHYRTGICIQRGWRSVPGCCQAMYARQQARERCKTNSTKRGIPRGYSGGSGQINARVWS